MDLQLVLDGLAANASNIPGLIALAYEPDAAPDVPLLFPAGVDTDFDQAHGRGQDRLDITMTLLLSRVDAPTRSQLQAGYMSGSGDYSLKAQLSRDRTLGGACSDMRVTKIRGQRFYELAGIRYLGATVVLFVIGRGN